MADFDELKDKKYPDSIIDEEEIAEPVTDGLRRAGLFQRAE